MGKWMRVVEVSTFQLLLMNLTKLCTNFISTPQRTLPPSLPVFFLIKLIRGQSLPFPLFYISSQMRDPVFATLASPDKYVTLYNWEKHKLSDCVDGKVPRAYNNKNTIRDGGSTAL